MTEGEWLGCKIPSLLTDYIGHIANNPRWVHRLKGKVVERKFRLLACALCRRLPCLLRDGRIRVAVDTSEKYADSIAHKGELRAAHRLAKVATDEAWADYAAQGYSEGAREKWAAAQMAAVATDGAKTVVSVSWASWPSRDADAVELIHEIFGNPFLSVPLDVACPSRAVHSLAQAIYNERTFERMPILADALEDAGCTNAEILAHCRSAGPHVCGCWVVDLILGKE